MLGVTQETLAGGGQFRAVAPALEQSRTKRGFQRVNARTHGRLGDVQAGRGGDKIAGGGHHEKGTRELSIHAGFYISKTSILDNRIYRWMDI